MKKNILSIICLTVFFTLIIIMVSSLGNNGDYSVHARSGGSPGGRTGSPSDNANAPFGPGNCTACHSGTVNSGSQTVAIEAADLELGYVPGQTYRFRASAGVNFQFGFEITAEEDLNNNKVGTFIITDVARTKFPATGNTSITHTAGGVDNFGFAEWFFEWTAPVAGTGDVTFYGAFNLADNDGSNDGDTIYTTSLKVPEKVVSGINDNVKQNKPIVYPNPIVSDFQINFNEEIESIEIYDLKAKKMVIDNKENKISISHLPSGVYLLRIESNKNVFSQKIMKK